MLDSFSSVKQAFRQELRIKNKRLQETNFSFFVFRVGLIAPEVRCELFAPAPVREKTLTTPAPDLSSQLIQP